jgi:hypothetical protein
VALAVLVVAVEAEVRVALELAEQVYVLFITKE